MPPDASPTTADRVLDIAERLVQTHGFNGFSYADISAELGITKASLHYHYRTKADLGQALVARYSDLFLDALADIDHASGDPREKLRRYADLYADVLRKERMCLCGMLAAEQATLPVSMQEGVKQFFDANEAWLVRVFEEGRGAGLLRREGPVRDAARLFLGALEGAMLIARSFRDPVRFDAASALLLAEIVAAPSG